MVSNSDICYYNQKFRMFDFQIKILLNMKFRGNSINIQILIFGGLGYKIYGTETLIKYYL